MQSIRVEDAIGSVLCHDITKIVPGEFKGVAFKKGHVIAKEDVPELLKLGKEHLYVWKMESGMAHENDAAIRIAHALRGSGLILSDPQEGKVNLIAAAKGMCTINESHLLKVNMIEEVVVATRNNRVPVNEGDIIAGIRVVPLVIAEKKLELIEALSKGHEVVKVKPYLPFRVGLVIIGNEVYNGLIEDKFGAVVKGKVENFNSRIIGQIIVPDDCDQIQQAIHKLIRAGAQLILTTGGMSVDPDDVTPKAIREIGASIVSYGAPVLPGSMLMAAYLKEVPILGLPGCVMYNKITVFDLLLPTILCGEKVTRKMITRLGMGGLCLNCAVCHYPACSFGTGA